MGEKAHLPQENNLSNDSQNPDEQMSESEDGDEFDDMSPEEFQMLDSQLDALNSALDDIEQKNDDIYSKLLQLLQSNREIRSQLQECKDKAGNAESQSKN